MAEAKKVNVLVKQAEDAPVAVEILAESIVQVSRASAQLLRSGLTKRALVTLIHDSVVGVGKREIQTILEALPMLESRFTTLRAKAK